MNADQTIKTENIHKKFFFDPFFCFYVQKRIKTIEWVWNEFESCYQDQKEREKEDENWKVNTRKKMCSYKRDDMHDINKL